ncbi:hypothetical protein [Rhizobium leguminosarum]|uniref:hypothetical protein n=1 Tax=Rhizobium leguminosarum TaxID=384 RepID=UPI001039CC46|nr:hypothetical protein [Rhizobium leguminosarum]TBY41171.1 hypothetical protein E0H60_09600 [Rhizobium leguminosarum bv. viciae]
MGLDTAADDIEKTSLSPHSFAALVAGSVLTALWLLLSYGYLIKSNDSCTYLALHCIQSVNDWGDFFAGTFSPLAFVWLVVAVILQSMELREQRAELKLTRAEFAQNREVARTQATESKRQAEFIGEQTKLLQEQEQRNKAEDAEAQFNAAIEILAATLINYDHIWSFGFSDNERALSFRLESYRRDSDRRLIIAAGQELRQALRELTKRAEEPLRAVYPRDFARTYRVVRLAVDSFEPLEGRSRHLAVPLGLHALRGNMELLVHRAPGLQALMDNDAH